MSVYGVRSFSNRRALYRIFKRIVFPSPSAVRACVIACLRMLYVCDRISKRHKKCRSLSLWK